MKTAIVLLSIMAMLLLGCSSSLEVYFQDKEQWIPKAQKDLLNEDATVVTTDGRGHEGKIVRIDTDSLWLQGESSNSPIAVQLDQVSLIRPFQNVVAPLGGFAAGALVGFLVGGSIGASQPTEQPDPRVLGLNAGLEKVGDTAAGTYVGGVLGGVIGGVVLGLATSVTNYQILHIPPHEDSTRPGPIPLGSTPGSK